MLTISYLNIVSLPYNVAILNVDNLLMLFKNQNTFQNVE